MRLPGDGYQPQQEFRGDGRVITAPLNPPGGESDVTPPSPKHIEITISPESRQLMLAVSLSSNLEVINEVRKRALRGKARKEDTGMLIQALRTSLKILTGE